MKTFKQYLKESDDTGDYSNQLSNEFLSQYVGNWIGTKSDLKEKELLIIQDFLKEKYGDDALIVFTKSPTQDKKSFAGWDQYYILLKKTNPDAKLFKSSTNPVETKLIKTQLLNKLLHFMHRRGVDVEKFSWWFQTSTTGDLTTRLGEVWFKWKSVLDKAGENAKEMFGGMIRSI